jgi:hypothetical protein
VAGVFIFSANVAKADNKNGFILTKCVELDGFPLCGAALE